MNYELALELKNAGFPQMMAGEGYYNDSHFDPVVDELKDNVVYFPTLEELIEACGEDFRWLKHRGNEWLAQQRQHPVELGDVRAKGSTHSEAVARLWLALNKKVV